MAQNTQERKAAADNRSELARNNRMVANCHLLEVSIIVAAYFLEYVKGARTLTYVLVMVVLGFTAPVAERALLKKNPESGLVIHFVGLGFAVFYIFLMFTTTNTLAFVYAIPMVVAISVFDRLSFTIPVNIGIVIVNIGQVIMFLKKGVYTMADLASVEIQVLIMIMIGVYSVYAAKTYVANNAVKMQKMKQQGEKTEQLLTSTMDISGKISGGIEEINQMIEGLDDAIGKTRDAMQGVTTGSADTADAVQKQLEMTDNIQTKVDDVKAGTKRIAGCVTDAKDAVNEGKEHVAGLVDRVHESVDTGKNVAGKLEELQDIMQKMTSVVDIITNITSQTSLLALNASIEAARAGDAGRGFAVVATEITKMADETQRAAVSITDMINEVSSAMENVVGVTNQMIEGISGQLEATNRTAASFRSIESNTASIDENTSHLAEVVEELAEANLKIGDSVSTISAISEEVAAHANDTFSISEQNSERVAEVLRISGELKSLAEQLNSESEE